MWSSTSRRRACVRCATGKRRCDGVRPKCTRCARFNAICQYIELDDTTVSTVQNPSGASLPMGGESQSHDTSLGDMVYSSRALSHAVELPRARLLYCAQRLRQCTNQMLETGGTMFIRGVAHGGDVFQPCRDAYATCAVYSCRPMRLRNAVNSLLIDKYRELLHVPPTDNIRLELAQCQSVLLLHIFQLFDGDEELRRESEKSLNQMRGKILRLQLHAESKVHEEEDYRDWILAESIRRTILAGTFAEAIYLTLREGICTTLPFMSLLPITVSGELWATASEAEWRNAREKSTTEAASYAEAVELWADPSTAHELEDFQKILFAACRGVPDSVLRAHDLI